MPAHRGTYMCTCARTHTHTQTHTDACGHTRARPARSSPCTPAPSQMANSYHPAHREAPHSRQSPLPLGSRGRPERQSQSEKQLVSSRGGSWSAEHKVGAQEKPAEGPKTMFTTDREALCLQVECRGASQLPQEAGGLASCRRGNRGPRGNGVLSRAPRSAHLLPLALRVCRNSSVPGGCTLAHDTPLILEGSPVG